MSEKAGQNQEGQKELSKSVMEHIAETKRKFEGQLAEINSKVNDETLGPEIEEIRKLTDQKTKEILSQIEEFSVKSRKYYQTLETQIKKNSADFTRIEQELSRKSENFATNQESTENLKQAIEEIKEKLGEAWQSRAKLATTRKAKQR